LPIRFFALSARVMRRILVDSARARGQDKRGGGARKVTFDEALLVPPQAQPDFVALDEALRVSPDTVKRDWRFAKLWLLRELSRA